MNDEDINANDALDTEEVNGNEGVDQDLDQGQDNGQGGNNEQQTEDEGNKPSRSERRETSYIDRLGEQIRSSSYQPTDSQYRSNYKPLEYSEGDEIDPAELKRDRDAYGQDQYQRGISEAQRLSEANRVQNWATQFDLDTDRSHRLMPELDPNSDSFDAGLEERLTKGFMNFVGFNQDDKGRVTIDRPNVRFFDFVRAEKDNMDFYTGRASERSAQNISKQASNTGIRPNGQPRQNSHANATYEEIMALPADEYNKWGRAAADKILNERLGIK